MPALHLPLFRSQTFPLLRDGGFTIVDYAGQAGIWRHVFLPQLAWSLGWGWPLILALPLVGTGLAARLAGPRRLVAACAAVAFLTYLVTPFSAGGPQGHPGFLFYVNLRYLATALVLGGVALAVVPLGRRADRWVGAAGAAALALAFWPGWRVPGWPGLHQPDRKAATLVAVGLIAVGAVVAGWLPGRWRASVCGLACLALVGTSAWVAARPPGPAYEKDVAELAGAYHWANAHHAERIGTAGISLIYPLAGVDLSNRVTYVGVRSAHGAFADAPDCRSWRASLAAVDPTYLVLGAEGDLNHPVHLVWVTTDPAASRLKSYGGITVWSYHSGGSPAPC